MAMKVQPVGGAPDRERCAALQLGIVFTRYFTFNLKPM
jgi:hypothetical protein